MNYAAGGQDVFRKIDVCDKPVVCKLDGTARGGVVVAVHRDTGLPVKYVGLGEGATDLEPFDSRSFAEGLVR